MAYPCGCTPSEVSDPEPCASGTCLRVPNVTIQTADSLIPCGATAAIDIAALSTLTSCTGSIIWVLLPGWDTDAFASASIDEFGVIHLVTTSAAVVGKFYYFHYKAMCSNSILSVQRTLKIPIRNACETSNCEPGTHCNPCSPIGACIPDTIDLILT